MYLDRCDSPRVSYVTSSMEKNVHEGSVAVSQHASCLDSPKLNL